MSSAPKSSSSFVTGITRSNSLGGSNGLNGSFNRGVKANRTGSNMAQSVFQSNESKLAKMSTGISAGKSKHL